MKLSPEAEARIESHMQTVIEVTDPKHIAILKRSHGENYIEAIRKMTEEHEQELALKVGYDAWLFYPHDMEGTDVDLDAEAFEVILAWESLSDDAKQLILKTVRENQ